MNSFDPCYRPRQWCPDRLLRQLLDLQNAESSTAWIISFLAKSRAEKKEDILNTNGTIQDLQVANLFFIMCRQDAISKLRSQNSPRYSIDTPYRDIRLAIQKIISPNERVVTADRAKFLSVIQGGEESDGNFLAPLGEEARYSDFEKLKTATNPEDELVKVKFISDLRDHEVKLRLLDGIKAKQNNFDYRNDREIILQKSRHGFCKIFIR